MGKEKEMLKTLLANTELIMKHLKIEQPNTKETKKEPKAETKKPGIKKLPARKMKK